MREIDQKTDTCRKKSKLKQKYKSWFSSDKLGTTFKSFVVFDSLVDALEDMEQTLAYLLEDPDVKEAADLIGYVEGMNNGLLITVTGFDSEGDKNE